MAKCSTKPASGDDPDRGRPARFEYRVWGNYRTARKLIAKMADAVTHEQVDDCYLLSDDPQWNAKVRDDTLKLKQLVSEKKGFERWSSERHQSAESAPSPFDEIYEELRLDRLGSKKYTIERAVRKLDDDSSIRAVFVSKDRRRYTLGSLRAEVTDITILETGEVLRTLSIEGDDLKELVKLRKQLGLKGETNTAVHEAIDAEVESER